MPPSAQPGSRVGRIVFWLCAVQFAIPACAAFGLAGTLGTLFFTAALTDLIPFQPDWFTAAVLLAVSLCGAIAAASILAGLLHQSFGRPGRQRAEQWARIGLILAPLPMVTMTPPATGLVLRILEFPEAVQQSTDIKRLALVALVGIGCPLYAFAVWSLRRIKRQAPTSNGA